MKKYANRYILRSVIIMIATYMVIFGMGTLDVSAMSHKQINSLVIKTLYGGKGGRMTCDFDGYKKQKGRHEGVDYKLKEGANIYAISAGTVTKVKNTNSNKKLSTLAIYDSVNKKTVVYLHAKNIVVKKGQKIKQGQKIAKEGNRAGGSAHTHIEVRNGRKTSAAKSVGDRKLDNKSPYGYFEKVLTGAKKVTKAPKVTSSKTKYATGDSAKITWSKVSNATNYTLKITCSGKLICNKTYTKASSYTLKKLTAGTYKASVTASNSSSKTKKTGSCSFTAQPMVKTAPDVRRDKSSYLVGESATITWNKVANADTYKLKAYGPGNFSVSRTVPGGSGCIIKSLKHGRYTVSVTATNTKSKTSQKKDISFVVNYPSSQTHPKGSQVVSDGVYHIVSDLDPAKNLNIKSYSKENGANVQLWASTNDKRQAVQVTYLGNGYYQLLNVNSGKSLDVQPNSFKPGLNVQQWHYAGTNNQQWVIRLAADGSFNIISKHNSMYLDVAGDKATNGANIQVNKSDGSKGQKWRFIADGRSTGKTISNGTYYIVSALDKTKNLNVKSTSKQNGANIQLWATQHDPKHKFRVTYLGNGYYKITNANSGKALDVKSPGVKSGSNVQQWSYAGTDNQQWIVKSAGSGYYYIIAKNSGLYLDAANGKSSNGTNVQVYLGNRSKAQKWKFVK